MQLKMGGELHLKLNIGKRVKQYVKLLKGKRLKSVASTETQPCLGLVYFSARRVSVNFAPRIMARERWHLYGCVIVSCRMRGVGLRNSARTLVSGLRPTSRA